MTSTFNPKQYTIVDVIDLMDYDYRTEALVAKLESLKKDVFEPDEKILVLHNDTEYFYLDSNVGFSTYNLFRAWQYADIPWHVMVLYANQCGIEKSIYQHWQFLNVDRPTVVENLVNNYNIFYSKAFLQEPEDKKISQKAVCLMGGTVRSQRIALYKWLKFHHLLNDVCTSFSTNSSILQQTQGKDSYGRYKNTEPLPDLDTVSSNIYRSNESFLLNSPADFEPWVHTETEYHKHTFLDQNLHSIYQSTFADIVCETVFQYPGAFFSEKTLRPILAKTPFVLFGAAGSLACLHNHGFETFGHIWDESYDLEQDHHLRFLKCCSIIKEIASMSTPECANLYEQLKPTVEHNRQVLLKYIDNTYQTLYSVVENKYD